MVLVTDTAEPSADMTETWVVPSSIKQQEAFDESVHRIAKIIYFST